MTRLSFERARTLGPGLAAPASPPLRLTAPLQQPASAPERAFAWAWAHPIAAALGLLVVFRLPGFFYGVLNIDETDFLLAGRMLRDGALPYVDLVEKKPLLAYLFYAPASIFGFAMWPMQLLALGWVLATCAVVGRAARARTRRKEDERAALLLCALAACAAVPSINTETMLNLPAAGALLCFVAATRAQGRKRAALDALCGLCVGLATLFKHQAGILLLAFIGAFVWEALHGTASPAPLAAPLAIAPLPAPRAAAGLLAALSRATLLVLGAALPWALALLAYIGAGHLDAFVEWNFTRNLIYAGHGSGSALWRLLGGLLIGVALATPLHWALSIAETRRGSAFGSGPAASVSDPGDRVVRAGLLLALWLTWLPVSMGGRFYDHYFLQFIPALSLLAAPRAAALVRRFPRLSPSLRWASLAALLIPLIAWGCYGQARGALSGYPAQEPRTRELAAWLRANSTPADRLFVWGHYTPIYYLAERLPGTRYYNASVHIGDFDPGQLPDGFDVAPFVSARDVLATLDDLERNRPALFVDTAPSGIHDWDRIPLSKVPVLQNYLRDHYQLAGRAGGALIYRRR